MAIDKEYSFRTELTTLSELAATSAALGLMSSRRLSGSRAGLVALGTFATLTTTWQVYRYVTLAELTPQVRLEKLQEVRREQAREESTVRNVALTQLGLADPKQPLADLSPNQMQGVSEIKWERFKDRDAISRCLAGARVRKVIGKGKTIDLPILAPLARILAAKATEDGKPQNQEQLLEDLDQSARDLYKDWVADPAANFCVDRGWDMTELSWGILADVLSSCGMPSLRDTLVKDTESRVLNGVADVASSFVQDKARDGLLDADKYAREKLSEKLTGTTYPLAVQLFKDLLLVVAIKGTGEGSLANAVAPVVAGGVTQKPYELLVRGSAGAAMVAFPKRRGLIFTGMKVSLFMMGMVESYLRTQREDAIFDLMTERSFCVKESELGEKQSRVANNLFFMRDPLEDDSDDRDGLGSLLNPQFDLLGVDEESEEMDFFMDGAGGFGFNAVPQERVVSRDAAEPPKLSSSRKRAFGDDLFEVDDTVADPVNPVVSDEEDEYFHEGMLEMWDVGAQYAPRGFY